MCYVQSSNIKLGLLTKIVVHFYTDFTSWLPKQIFLLLLCIGDYFDIEMDFEILYQQNESIWYKGIVSIPKVSDFCCGKWTRLFSFSWFSHSRSLTLYALIMSYNSAMSLFVRHSSSLWLFKWAVMSTSNASLVIHPS